MSLETVILRLNMDADIKRIVVNAVEVTGITGIFQVRISLELTSILGKGRIGNFAKKYKKTAIRYWGI